jgi:hypothetical protein
VTLPQDHSVEALIETGRGLIQSWENSDDSFSTKRGDTDAARLSVVYALAAHVHRVAPIAFELIERGQVLESVALVRVCYETALNCQWLVQVSGAPAAAANEHIRNQRNLRDTLLKSANLRHIGEKMIEEEPIPQVENVSARSTEAICNSLAPGGAEACAHYRLMSQLSHPSVFLADYYLSERADAPWGVALHQSPAQHPPALPYAGFTTAALIWSGRAVDYLDKTHKRRSELRKAAKHIGITSELQPTPEALGFGIKK